MPTVDIEIYMLAGERQARDPSLTQFDSVKRVQNRDRAQPEIMRHELHRWIADTTPVVSRHPQCRSCVEAA